MATPARFVASNDNRDPNMPASLMSRVVPLLLSVATAALASLATAEATVRMVTS